MQMHEQNSEQYGHYDVKWIDFMNYYRLKHIFYIAINTNFITILQPMSVFKKDKQNGGHQRK